MPSFNCACPPSACSETAMETISGSVECPVCSEFVDSLCTQTSPAMLSQPCHHELSGAWNNAAQSVFLPRITWQCVPSIAPPRQCAQHRNMDTFLRCVTCDSKPFCFSCFAEDVTDTSHIGHRVVQVTAGAASAADTTAAAADSPPAHANADIACALMCMVSMAAGGTKSAEMGPVQSSFCDSEAKSEADDPDTSGVTSGEACGMASGGVRSNNTGAYATTATDTAMDTSVDQQ